MFLHNREDVAAAVADAAEPISLAKIVETWEFVPDLLHMTRAVLQTVFQPVFELAKESDEALVRLPTYALLPSTLTPLGAY